MDEAVIDCLRGCAAHYGPGKQIGDYYNLLAWQDILSCVRSCLEGQGYRFDFNDAFAAETHDGTFANAVTEIISRTQEA